jgi:hypothetical protein
MRGVFCLVCGTLFVQVHHVVVVLGYPLLDYLLLGYHLLGYQHVLGSEMDVLDVEVGRGNVAVGVLGNFVFGRHSCALSNFGLFGDFYHRISSGV